MGNLFKAFLFKLKSDITFRILFFIGIGLAILSAGLYGLLDYLSLQEDPNTQLLFCTGTNMFISSLSPMQNFGLAIPIGIITFIVSEFNHGIIRNKIITGNSKFMIYFSLLLGGIVMTFLLLGVYSITSLVLGLILGGMKINGSVLFGTTMGFSNAEFFWKTIVMVVFIYVFIASMTVFFATLFRSIGPAIPCILLSLIALYMISSFAPMLNENIEIALRYINPMHGICYASMDMSTGEIIITNERFIGCLASNTVYCTGFILGGAYIFANRDVK